MNKYFFLFSLLENKTKIRVIFLVFLCILIGTFDFLAVLSSAQVDLNDTSSVDFYFTAVFFALGTLFRILFLIINARVCAAVSSEASLVFLRRKVMGFLRSSSGDSNDNKSYSIESDILAKTANLANFVINPFFHFLVALVSLIGITISLILALPDLFFLMVVVTVVGAFMILGFAFISRRVGAGLRAKQDNAAQFTKELFSLKSNLRSHPRLDLVLSRFFSFDYRYKYTLSILAVLGQAPKLTIDFSIAAGLVWLVFFPDFFPTGLREAGPTLGVATIRLIPYLNSLGQAVMTLKGYAPSVLDALYQAAKGTKENHPLSGEYRLSNAAAQDDDVVVSIKGLKILEQSVPLDATIRYGQKIFVSGAPGSGLNMLIPCLLGETRPESGLVNWNPKVELAPCQVVFKDLPVLAESLSYNVFLAEGLPASSIDTFPFDFRQSRSEQFNPEQITYFDRVAINVLRAVQAQPKVIFFEDIFSELNTMQRSLLIQLISDVDCTVVICGREGQKPSNFKEISVRLH